MADERDEDKAGETTGQQNQQNETGQKSQQQAGDLASQQTMSGQPTGGDKREGAGGGQSSSGQADPGRSGGTDTLAGSGTLGNASDLGGGETGLGGGDRQSREGSSGEGFIGSQGTGPDKFVQDDQNPSGKASNAEGTDGSDFASQGRGALDKDEDESGSGSTGGGSPS